MSDLDATTIEAPTRSRTTLLLVGYQCCIVTVLIHLCSDLLPPGFWQFTAIGPVQLALLASFSWLFWAAPAGFLRRSAFVALTIAFSWISVPSRIVFPMTVLSYGFFLVVYLIASDLIGLKGWNDELKLVTGRAQRARFSIKQMLWLTSVVAILCVASIGTPTSLRLREFYVTTTGLAVSAVFIQHAFTLPKRHDVYVVLAGMTNVVAIAAVASSRFLFAEVRIYPGVLWPGGFLYSGFWFDVFVYFVVFHCFLMLFSVAAGWQFVKQRCAEQRTKSLKPVLEPPG